MMGQMRSGRDGKTGSIGLSLFTRIVRECWSDRTATTYSAANPARGQCSVTALLAQEYLGGEIAKTRVQGRWHFYNIIEGQRFDFTVSQFDQVPRYEDARSDRLEAMADTSPAQRDALASALRDIRDRLS